LHFVQFLIHSTFCTCSKGRPPFGGDGAVGAADADDRWVAR